MYHSLDGLTPKPEIAWYLENLIPYNGILHSRPAFVTGGTVGAGGAATGQGIVTFISSTTERIIAVSAGEIYDVSGTTWTRRVTTANLAAATGVITLNATGRVYMVQFGAYLIFSDGTNTPFRWDGTAGAGGLTKLTNCPVLFGQPVVYYAKVFGIKNDARDTIVWSEENDATTGYNGGSYLNIWRFTQTGGGPLYSLAAENEQLVYFRASNIGAVRGAVGPAFTSTGVHDAIDLETGSVDPRGAIKAYGAFWFYDQQFRPCVLRNGQVFPLWNQMVAAFGADVNSQPYRGASGTTGYISLATGTNTVAGIAIYPSLDAVMFWYTSTPSAAPVFNGRTNALLCYFSTDSTVGGGFLYTATTEQTGDCYLLHNTSAVGRMLALTDLGRTSTLSPDQYGSGTAFIPSWNAVLSKLGLEQTQHAFYDLISIEAEREGASGVSSTTGFTIRYLTSNQPTMDVITAAVTVAPTIERHQQISVGIAGYGRWIAPIIGVTAASTTTVSPVHIYRVGVSGYTDADDPAMT